MPIGNLRQRIEGIVWRCGTRMGEMARHAGRVRPLVEAGADLHRLGVWERLLELVQAQLGFALGMVFLDGTSIRAHQKAAGAAKKGNFGGTGSA